MRGKRREGKGGGEGRGQERGEKTRDKRRGEAKGREGRRGGERRGERRGEAKRSSHRDLGTLASRDQTNERKQRKKTKTLSGIPKSGGELVSEKKE